MWRRTAVSSKVPATALASRLGWGLRSHLPDWSSHQPPATGPFSSPLPVTRASLLQPGSVESGTGQPLLSVSALLGTEEETEAQGR